MAILAPQVVAQSIADFLKNKTNTSKIRFRINKIQVSPERFASASEAIRSGKIKVEIDSSLSHNGTYNTVKNVLSIKNQNIALHSALIKAFIIHEAVHMGNDVDKIGVVRAIDEEAAGFIAQAVYLKVSSGQSLIDRSNKKINAMYMSANEAADYVIKGSAVELFNFSVNDVRSKLKEIGIYKKIISTNIHHNGV
jgi:hypothetical protein